MMKKFFSLIGDNAHAGIVGHHQVAGDDQLAAQGNRAIHLHSPPLLPMCWTPTALTVLSPPPT